MSLFFTDNIRFNQFWCWLFSAMMRDRPRQATERTPSNKTPLIFFGRAFSRKSKTYACVTHARGYKTSIIITTRTIFTTRTINYQFTAMTRALICTKISVQSFLRLPLHRRSLVRCCGDSSCSWARRPTEPPY
jgi:hypothetical protein